MSKFSKIEIVVFLTLLISIGFVVPRFARAQTEATVYVCPEVASLEEVNPRCPGKTILKLGETINGLTLATTNYENQEYYLVLGFINGGGGVNLPPVAEVNGPYQGDAGLPIVLDASNSSDPNNDPLQYRWDFDDDGAWDTEWLSVSIINHIWNNDYEGNIKLEISDGEFSAIDTAIVNVKSPKTLKEEAISELEAAKTGDKKADEKISRIIKHIQNSLAENLWLDASHLIFFKKDTCRDSEIFELNPESMNLEETFEFEPDNAELKMRNNFKEECFIPRFGLMVFHEEYLAVKSMLQQLKEKPRIPEELKTIFSQVIAKLVKADQLLAKVAIYDAKNTPIQNPKFQKLIDRQIRKAEEEFAKAEKEIANNKPDKAILRLAKSWLYGQLVIKFASL